MWKLEKGAYQSTRKKDNYLSNFSSACSIINQAELSAGQLIS
jgi:hypothetical protein